MQSVMGHSFSQVPSVSVERSTFDRSCGHKTTIDEGLIYPLWVDEALPGDTYKMKATLFARIATLLKPPMDNLKLDIHFFAIPNRLVWDNWVKMNGEQVNPSDTTDYQVPQMVSPTGGYVTGSLADYFGIPVGVEGLSHSALPFRAYAATYNFWYRDQNLQGTVPFSTGDGPDTPADYVLLRRNKAHDYFTSALPFAQKGTEVTMPLGQNAPVISTGEDFIWADNLGTGYSKVELLADRHVLIQNAPAANAFAHWGNVTGLEVDLQDATAATINNLRQAFQLQRLFERDARGGTRYPEILKAHWGVRDPQMDVLQRPQYLGGGSVNLVCHSVPQSSASGTYADTPQGNLSSYGTITGTGIGFTKSFTEHCILLGLVSVRADLTYQQGLDRMWSRKTRYDFYWPALAHLGEQAILNKEIYAQGTAGGTADDGVFGYQERFAEYRYANSKISGLFRSTATTGTPLDFWHLSQEFASLPTLSSQFIQENAPMDRIIAVPSEPDFIVDSLFQVQCTRPMPVFSVPGYIDHF